MPQFDPSTFGSQLFWLVLCFLVLNIAMVKWLLPRLRHSLEGRENMIKASQEKTKNLMDKITAINQEADHYLHLAHEQAREHIRQGLHDVDKKHQEILKSYEAKLQGKTVQYEAALNAQIEKARQDLSEAAVTFADDLTKKFFPHLPQTQTPKGKKVHQ